MFTILHRLLNNKNILEQVTREILEDFHAENCVYLELRTTPRNIYDKQTNQLLVSKAEYLQTVINVIKEFEVKHGKEMIVRLILSVDRVKGYQDGLENIELANKFKGEYVVGVDFSGNPKVSSFKELSGLFDLAKNYGLKLTVHIAEFWEDPDIDFILREVRPDRIGHSVCLTKEQINYLLENPIPIEICPTSNLITKCVDFIENHIFYEFYRLNKEYPMVICTDDFGIFDICLSDEYSLISNAFRLRIEDMFELSKKSVNFIFDRTESTLNILRNKFDKFRIDLI